MSRFISWLRLRRRYAPPAAVEIGVVDGTGYHVGEELRAVLIGTGLPATAIDAFDLTTVTGVLVLLMPVKPATFSQATQDLLSVLSAVSADPTIHFRARVVVAWHIILDVRRTMAAPERPADLSDGSQRWNAADLLLGNSWNRERQWHNEDAEAVRCRSARIGQLMLARGHDDLDLTTVAEFNRYLTAFDPGFLNSLVVQVSEPTENGSQHRWMGWESVAAATQAIWAG